MRTKPLRLSSIDDVEAESQRRTREQASIKREVDAVVSRAESDAGCGAVGGCLAFLFGRTRRATGAVAGAAGSASAVGARAGAGVRLWRRAATPHEKLGAAQQALGERSEAMRARAQVQRTLARALIPTDKPAALRALRKAKAYEALAATAASAFDALEQQTDLLEQAALQKDIAKALGTSVKQAAKAKGLLQKAEAATESAVELKDLVEDVGAVLGEVAGPPPDYDDDDLLAELEEMAEDGGGGPVAAAPEAAPSVPIGAYPSVPRDAPSRDPGEHAALMACGV
jgi:hypothetical protein